MTLLALVGPTASGKTEAALALAESLDAEIVSIDSMLVYRGMDVGTAKPTFEQRARVPHHLVDVVEPRTSFSVARYQSLALRAVDEIEGRGRRALLAGGSGLYLRAIVDRLEFPETDARARSELETQAAVLGPERLHARLADLDPVAAGRIEPANIRRTVRALEVAALTGRPFSSYAQTWESYPVERVRSAGVAIGRPLLAARIERRVARMLEGGFADEVRSLVDRGFGRWLTSSQAIGYAELARHLEGAISLDEATAATIKRTKALARRQLAWFRRDPRIRWFAAGEEGAMEVVDQLRRHLAGSDAVTAHGPERDGA